MQDAEDLEARALAGGPGAQKADRDDEIKPFVHKWVSALPACERREACSGASCALHAAATATPLPPQSSCLPVDGVPSPAAQPRCKPPSHHTRRGAGHGEEAQEGEEDEDEDEGDGIVHWNLRRSSAGA